MYELDAMKKVLGDGYKFTQSKTIEEIKKILETGEMDGNDTVPFVLEAGNLDIEVNIKWTESDDENDKEKAYLEYFCCIRKDGEWESFEEIPFFVNLNAPDMEAEMFKVLDKYADRRGFSFFADNELYRGGTFYSIIDQDDLMEKIEHAIINGNTDKDVTDAKWGLFRGLEVVPELSQEMIEHLYAKDDVAADMWEFVKENCEDENPYDAIDFHTVQDVADEYLENLKQQILARELYERADKELSEFLKNMKTEIISPDFDITDTEIITNAFQLAMMDKMLGVIEKGEILGTDELEALLTFEKPLDYLYAAWADNDENQRSVDSFVYSTARVLMGELEDKERGFEGEDENEEDTEI